MICDVSLNESDTRGVLKDDSNLLVCVIFVAVTIISICLDKFVLTKIIDHLLNSSIEQRLKGIKAWQARQACKASDSSC